MEPAFAAQFSIILTTAAAAACLSAGSGITDRDSQLSGVSSFIQGIYQALFVRRSADRYLPGFQLDCYIYDSCHSHQRSFDMLNACAAAHALYR
ncbi:hypothetical protein BKM12_15240 [Pseudomonas syringae pv. syringae]|jgi:hypothetical protein|nr:hypothetical protein BKM12_15240 [Pseudomonas syringae pv. syringae]